ncbi:hypothetical protein ABBQ38_008148 [Trebouxia sp. C0009 RCD-2024]
MPIPLHKVATSARNWVLQGAIYGCNTPLGAPSHGWGTHWSHVHPCPTSSLLHSLRRDRADRHFSTKLSLRACRSRDQVFDCLGGCQRAYFCRPFIAASCGGSHHNPGIAMRRGFSHSSMAAHCAKWLLRDLRLGIAFERSQASKSSSFGSASPVASQFEGTSQCQDNLPCFFSTQCQPVKQDGPDISLLEPALQKQWDYAANAHLGKVVIKPYSQKKVWWTCNQCPDGHLHKWLSIVNNRSSGHECPQCSGHKLCKHNALATKYPLVAAQWDYDANVGTPDDVVAHSGQAVGWVCDVCGSKWNSSPNERVGKNKRGCPHCAAVNRTNKRTSHPTFAKCKHPLLAEWDHIRNAAQGYFPHQTRLKSSKKIWWLCAKCPAGKEHSWAAQPHSRTGRSKTGCPSCAGQAACECNCLQTLYPNIAAEWDHDRNTGQPSDYPASSSHLAWWSSLQRGSWKQMITSRTDTAHQTTVRLRRMQQRQHSEPVP